MRVRKLYLHGPRAVLRVVLNCSRFCRYCRISGIALIAIDRNQREPRLRAKSDAGLNKVFIQVRGAFIEAFVEFDFEMDLLPAQAERRFPGRARGRSVSRLPGPRARVAVVLLPGWTEGNSRSTQTQGLCVGSPSIFSWNFRPRCGHNCLRSPKRNQDLQLVFSERPV